MQAVQNFLNQANTRLNALYNNPYVASVLTLFFILYAGLAAPDLPPVLAGIFGNPLFKVFILFLILFLRNFNPTLALLVSVGFILSLQTFHRYQSFTMLNDLSNLESAAKEMETANKNGMNGENGGQDGYFPEMMSVDKDSDTESESSNGSCLPDQPPAQLPPKENWNTQVTGLGAQNCSYQGPQGLEQPYGFGGVVCGAAYDREHSEL